MHWAEGSWRQALEQRLSGFIGKVDAGSAWESAQSMVVELTIASADEYLFDKLPQLNAHGDLVWRFSNEATEGATHLVAPPAR